MNTTGSQYHPAIVEMAEQVVPASILQNSISRYYGDENPDAVQHRTRSARTMVLGFAQNPEDQALVNRVFDNEDPPGEEMINLTLPQLHLVGMAQSMRMVAEPPSDLELTQQILTARCEFLTHWLRALETAEMESEPGVRIHLEDVTLWPKECPSAKLHTAELARIVPLAENELPEFLLQFATNLHAQVSRAPGNTLILPNGLHLVWWGGMAGTAPRNQSYTIERPDTPTTTG